MFRDFTNRSIDRLKTKNRALAAGVAGGLPNRGRQPYVHLVAKFGALQFAPRYRPRRGRPGAVN
jgi:hypothetical protein